MADHAVLLQDGRHVGDVVDLRGLLITGGKVDEAADGVPFCHLDGSALTADQRLDGVGGVVLAGLGALAFIVVDAVIERPPVGDLPGLGVYHQHLGSAHQPKGFADELRLVVKNGDVDVPFGSLLLDGGAVVLQVGVEHVELDALLPVLVAQRLVVVERIAHDGAAIALHHDDHRRSVPVVVELVGSALMVEQHEVVHAGGLRLSDNKGQGQRQG